MTSICWKCGEKYQTTSVSTILCPKCTPNVTVYLSNGTTLNRLDWMNRISKYTVIKNDYLRYLTDLVGIVRNTAGGTSMTRDEILSMKPGRELDALVAEKVMGWEYFPAQATGTFVRLGYFFDPVSGEAHHHWSPSTDIAAAWEVEKRALEIDDLLYVAALMQVIYGDIDKVDYIENIDPDNAIKWCALPALFKATPEQRCKAALLAVMERSTHRWCCK